VLVAGLGDDALSLRAAAREARFARRQLYHRA
jgi:hypothetical protein